MHPQRVQESVRAFPDVAHLVPTHYIHFCRWAVSGKTTRISVTDFHTGLRLSGTDVSVEEAECLVANMIYKGYMRGYISHEKQMVVLANTNAFPRLADRPSPYTMV